MKLSEVVDILVGKENARAVLIIVCTVWLTWWTNDKLHDIRDSLIREFTKRDDRSEKERLLSLSQFAMVSNQISRAWTVDMMVARDQMVAMWNPSNRIPDAYRIFNDMRNGREPVGVRIGP